MMKGRTIVSEQIQRQPQRTKREEATVEEVEFDRTETDEVLAECDNCLSNIDDVLTEVIDRELTDSEVFDLGHPDDWDDDVDLSAMDGEEYDAAVDRYEAAYENVTGMTFTSRCGC